MCDILKAAKILLNIKTHEFDELLKFYIDVIEQKILNYCNISELPEGLYFEAAQMVAEMYRNSSDEGGVTGKVSSVSEAGRSVSFDSSLASTAAENALNERKTQLNRFKLVYR